MKEFDCVIIGSGIAGMTSAIYLKRAGINTLIIESSAPGGQMLRSFSIENYPGYKNIDGPSLAYNIFEQVNELNTPYLYEEVIEVDFDNNIVKTTNNEIKYKYLIIATGRRPRKLNLTNEELLEGKGISYCALCDGNFYKDKEVIVVGGGNSAVEEALYLSNICKKVTVVYRGNKLKAEQNMIDKLNNKENIEVLYNSELKEYIIKDNKLDKVLLNNDKTLDVDGIFMAIGYIPNSEIFNLERVNDYILVDNNLKTSINDVYACGDIIRKELYQLTTAVGEASIVANNIIKDINNNLE